MNLIVLAGGKSSRLGYNKTKAKVKGRLLIEYVISRLSPLFEKIYIVINENKEEFYTMGYNITKDTFTDSGPLAGIHAGLCSSDSENNFVIACDMPYIPIPLVTYMMTFRKYDVVVPRRGEFVEPLCAIYRKSVIPVIEKQIEFKQLKIQDMFFQLKVKYIEEDEISRYDPDGLAFYNINTPNDLKRLS